MSENQYSEFAQVTSVENAERVLINRGAARHIDAYEEYYRHGHGGIGVQIHCFASVWSETLTVVRPFRGASMKL